MCLKRHEHGTLICFVLFRRLRRHPSGESNWWSPSHIYDHCFWACFSRPQSDSMVFLQITRIYESSKTDSCQQMVGEAGFAGRASKRKRPQKQRYNQRLVLLAFLQLHVRQSVHPKWWPKRSGRHPAFIKPQTTHIPEPATDCISSRTNKMAGQNACGLSFVSFEHSLSRLATQRT